MVQLSQCTRDATVLVCHVTKKSGSQVSGWRVALFTLGCCLDDIHVWYVASARDNSLLSRLSPEEKRLKLIISIDLHCFCPGPLRYAAWILFWFPCRQMNLAIVVCFFAKGMGREDCPSRRDFYPSRVHCGVAYWQGDRCFRVMVNTTVETRTISTAVHRRKRL